MSAIWDSRKVRENEFPYTGTPAEKLQFLANYGVLASCAHHLQPWLCKIENEAILLYANRNRVVPIADSSRRELIISCGMALFNIRLALRHFGYKDEITAFPDPNNPDLLAYIPLRTTQPESADERMLFDAIANLHQHRRDFQDWDVPKSLLSWLEVDAEQEGAWLYIVKNDTSRQAVAELILQGIKKQQFVAQDDLKTKNPNFCQDSTSYLQLHNHKQHQNITNNRHSLKKHFDFANPIVSLMRRTFNLGDAIANRHLQLITRSPVIAVLGTKSDNPIHWLKTGQALERILLRGQSVGLAASFLNQVIQLPELRLQLNTLIHEQGYPQVLLRMGFDTKLQPTSRQTVAQAVF